MINENQFFDPRDPSSNSDPDSCPILPVSMRKFLEHKHQLFCFAFSFCFVMTLSGRGEEESGDRM